MEHSKQRLSSAELTAELARRAVIDPALISVGTSRGGRSNWHAFAAQEMDAETKRTRFIPAYYSMLGLFELDDEID